MKNSTGSPEERLLTEIELAQRWKISTKKLQRDRSMRTGVKWVKLGRCVRYPLSWVREFEEVNTNSMASYTGGRNA